MNKYTKAFSTSLIIGAMVASGCNPLQNMVETAKKQELKVNPSPLELHGDSVSFSVSAKLPKKMLKTGTTYTLESSYQPANKEAFKISDLKFRASDFENSDAEPVIEKQMGFAYVDDFERGKMVIKGTAEKNGKIKEGQPMDLPGGNGVITTSKLMQPTYYVNYIPHAYDPNREEYAPSYNEFLFQKGKSSLRRSEKRSDRGKDFEAYIAARTNTKSVTLTGMHSPEGSTKVNTDLANDRPQAVKEYYKKLMSKYNYGGDTIENLNFIAKPVIQDWRAFKEVLQENEKLTDKQKNEVLAIVDGPGDFVSKELKLQALSSYRKLMRYVYPSLRNTRVELMKIKDKLTEAEIVVMGTKIANGEEGTDKLREDELAFAATKTPDLGEKEKIYLAAIKKSDKYYSYNNLGAVYLDLASKENDNTKKMAMIDKAITQFEMSVKKQETPEAYVNLAGAKLMKGDQAAAMQSLNKVSGAASGTVGTSVNALKGYAFITKGNYNSAIQSLSAAGNNPVVLYNKALAILLKASKERNSDDYVKAESAFKEAIDADNNNGYAYYGAAITAARMGDETKLVTNLKKAAQLNSDLKTRAASDLEFQAFLTNQGFLDALK